MKKATTALIIAILVTTLSGCVAPPSTPIKPTQTAQLPMPTQSIPVSTPGIQNTVEEVENADAFTSMDLVLEAPEGAENVKYSIIGKDIAQIKYTVDDIDYTLRSSLAVTDEELHGVNNLANTGDNYGVIQSGGEHIDESGNSYEYTVVSTGLIDETGAVGLISIPQEDGTTLAISLYTKGDKDYLEIQEIMLLMYIEHYK